MKTIRTNCFETNSSSTHSVTIISKRDDDKKPLIKDGVLYPQNLRYCSAYRSDSQGGYSLHASTVAEKAALLIHHILSYENYSDDSEGISEAVDHVINELVHAYQVFKAIDMSDVHSAFNGAADEDTTYIDNMMSLTEDDRKAALDDIIRNIVLNDDKIIVDEDNSY